MTALMKILSDQFEEFGLDVQVIWMDGRPHWTYKTASRLAGHKDVRVTMTVVGRDSEFDDPAYTTTLTGARLKEFKALPQVLNQELSAYASRVTLFTEAGLWLLIDKSDSKIGREYRKLFCTQVAPQIARDGQYSPEREVTPEGQLVEREAAQAAERDHMAAEERRLAVEVEKRKLAAEALWRLCDVLKDATYLKDDVKKSLAVAAAEEASGRSLAGFLPPADASFQWESPTQIAERLRVTVQRVGKAITTLGLRGVEGMSRAIVNKASHSDRTVTTYLYSPEAVARIEEYLLGAGSAAHP